jgi:hypothetical protein
VSYLPPTRALRPRLDAAQAMSQFFYRAEQRTLKCARAILGAPLERKAVLARVGWESSLAADAFRERVFELRYPSRFLDEQREGDPALSYEDYLRPADELSDGPSIRIVRSALADEAAHEVALAAETPPDAYFRSSFYWPDILDPDYAYGEGIALQLRSAVSHLNEVWAVDTAARILAELSPELGWEFTREAARWLYDETRHMLMGKERLERWGFRPEQIPLGGYIYEAWQDEDPLYGLGMLGYFETKNIGRKRERAAAFHEMGDATSETDMEFDWADETLHAEYGRRWLRRLLEVRGEDPESWPAVLERCEQLVADRLARSTPEDLERIRAAADALISAGLQGS